MSEKSNIDSTTFSDPDNGVGAVLLASIYIGPDPDNSQSRLMSGIFFLMASTILRVGLVRPLKMLLNEAGDISMN